MWLQAFVAPERGARPSCAEQTSSQPDEAQAQHQDSGCAAVQLQQDMVHGALFKVVLQQLGQFTSLKLVLLSCPVCDQRPTHSALHNFLENSK